MSAPAALEVENRMFAALAVLRAVLLVNTVAMTALRWDNFRHQQAALALVAGVVVWSGVVSWLCATPARRRTWVLVADLAIAFTSLVLSPVLKGASFNAALLGFWIAAPLLAWAVRWHVTGGLAAGALLGVTDLMVRDHVTTNEWGNVFLLLVAGLVVGHLSGTVQQMATDRAAAERAAAAATERTRLARAVHDGVLQVLALVQRRGTEAGGEFAQLGRLAGEQETSLRAMIRQQDHLSDAPRIRAHLPGPAAVASTDLTNELDALSSTTVTVSTPGRPVLLPAPVAADLVAAVTEAVANVARHVGPEAPTWLLLEEREHDLVVTVRDEGPGIAPERLAQAERAGRLGVASSIRGRLADLGGTAHLTSDAWGSEWEFTLPRNGETPS